MCRGLCSPCQASCRHPSSCRWPSGRIARSLPGASHCAAWPWRHCTGAEREVWVGAGRRGGEMGKDMGGAKGTTSLKAHEGLWCRAVLSRSITAWTVLCCVEALPHTHRCRSRRALLATKPHRLACTACATTIRPPCACTRPLSTRDPSPRVLVDGGEHPNPGTSTITMHSPRCGERAISTSPTLLAPALPATNHHARARARQTDALTRTHTHTHSLRRRRPRD
jgi:hypothetical protein